MSERGAYRQTSGRRVRREFDPFWNMGGLLETALAERVSRKAAKDAKQETEKINGDHPAEPTGGN